MHFLEFKKRGVVRVKKYFQMILLHIKLWKQKKEVWPSLILPSSWSQKLSIHYFPWLDCHNFLHQLYWRKHSFVHLLTTESRFGTVERRIWDEILSYNLGGKSEFTLLLFSISEAFQAMFWLYFPLGFWSFPYFSTGFSSLSLGPLIAGRETSSHHKKWYK